MPLPTKLLFFETDEVQPDIFQDFPLGKKRGLRLVITPAFASIVFYHRNKFVIMTRELFLAGFNDLKKNIEIAKNNSGSFEKIPCILESEDFLFAPILLQYARHQHTKVGIWQKAKGLSRFDMETLPSLHNEILFSRKDLVKMKDIFEEMHNIFIANGEKTLQKFYVNEV